MHIKLFNLIIGSKIYLRHNRARSIPKSELKIQFLLWFSGNLWGCYSQPSISRADNIMSVSHWGIRPFVQRAWRRGKSWGSHSGVRNVRIWEGSGGLYVWVCACVCMCLCTNACLCDYVSVCLCVSAQSVCVGGGQECTIVTVQACIDSAGARPSQKSELQQAILERTSTTAFTARPPILRKHPRGQNWALMWNDPKLILFQWIILKSVKASRWGEKVEATMFRFGISVLTSIYEHFWSFAGTPFDP